MPRDTDWLERFNIPWEKMPSGIQKSLKNKTKPNPNDKTQMVKILVDDIKKMTANIDIQQARILAQRIVREYTDSFEDRTDDGERIGDGCYSLTRKIKTRVEYTNRGNLLFRLRQTSSHRDGSSNPQADSEKNHSSSYGCTEWQPSSLPANETEETLIRRQGTMKEMIQRQGPANVIEKDAAILDDHMEKTYILQRRLINSTKPVPIETIKNDWPFLFIDRWLYSHFEKLVGKSPYIALREAMAVKSKRICQFFHATYESDADSPIPNNSVVATTMKLVMDHFKENSDSIFVLADVSTTSLL